MNNQNITRKKKKRAWLGYGREKLNVKDVLERLLDLPDESIKVYDINDKEYKIMKKAVLFVCVSLLYYYLYIICKYITAQHYNNTGAVIID